ncbi:hypothetical protein MAR_009451, partial [Mya arenaria]
MDDRTASRESPRRELVNTGGNDEEKEEKDEVPLFDAIPKGCRYKKDGECEGNEILLKLSLRTFFNLRRCERRIRVPCSVFEDVEKEPQRLVKNAGAFTNLGPFSAFGTKIKNARIASQESNRKEQQENGSADGVVDQEDGVPSYSEIPRGCRYREDGECDPLSGTMLMRRVRTWGWRCPRRIRVNCTLDKSEVKDQDTEVEVDKGDGEDITALGKALNNDPAVELDHDDGETMSADDETAGTSEERQLLVQPQ